MRRLLARAVLCLSLLLVPASLYAHALLLRSSPALHATITEHSPTIELHFNSRVDGPRSRLTLTTRALPDRLIALAPVLQPAPETLTSAPVAPLSTGDYVLHWIVLASDGHISRGEIPFTIQ